MSRFNDSDATQLSTKSYNASFTPLTMKSALHLSAMALIDEMRQFHQARPISYDNCSHVASAYALCKIFDEGRESQGTENIGNHKVQASRYLDTTYGAVLTHENSRLVFCNQETLRYKRRKEMQKVK